MPSMLLERSERVSNREGGKQRKAEEGKKYKGERGSTSRLQSAVFHSGAHMLLGTHPIPARSPAEREGQNGEVMRRDGGRQKDEEEKKRPREFGWLDDEGMSRWNYQGEDKKRGFGETGSRG